MDREIKRIGNYIVYSWHYVGNNLVMDDYYDSQLKMRFYRDGDKWCSKSL